MSLTFEIVGPQAVQLGSAARKTFLHQGGSIGRANANDWVIPDVYVSSQHARVHFRDGHYFLEDTSTNGVFIKNPGNRLPRGQQYPLHSGDRIFIDAFEIKVTIDSEPAAPQSVSQPSLFEDVSKQNSVIATAAIEKSPRDEVAAASEVNGIPVELTIPLPEPSDAIIDLDAMDRVANLGLEANSEPLESISVDFDPFGDAPLPSEVDQEVLPAATPSTESSAKMRKQDKSVNKPSAKRKSQASDNNALSATSEQPVAVDLHALLASAGLDATSVTPEFAENLGGMLRVVIAGVMELLQAREQAKVEFGMRNTSYKKIDNNPLKLSVNVEDALHNLLVKRNAAYLGPVDAFEDVFRDMRFHELATLEAMKAAFNAMLQSFSPDNLQINFNKEVKQGAIWSGPIKLRYWDLYRERYKALTRNPEQCFRDLFADEFVKAYSAHLEKLKTGKKKS